jgi:CheY-like chemotaxis protein
VTKQCILYVEDKPEDEMLFRYAMERLGVAHALWVVRDGREAITYLEGRGKFCDRELYPLPGIVILDWRLPRLPGAAVLRWIRHQPKFARLRVLVLSYADRAEVVREAFAAGANGYYLKPSSFTAIVRFASEVVSVLSGNKEPSHGVVTLLAG